jgi:hypothetical protein
MVGLRKHILSISLTGFVEFGACYDSTLSLTRMMAEPKQNANNPIASTQQLSDKLGDRFGTWEERKVPKDMFETRNWQLHDKEGRPSASASLVVDAGVKVLSLDLVGGHSSISGTCQVFSFLLTFLLQRRQGKLAFDKIELLDESKLNGAVDPSSVFAPCKGFFGLGVNNMWFAYNLLKYDGPGWYFDLGFGYNSGALDAQWTLNGLAQRNQKVRKAKKKLEDHLQSAGANCEGISGYFKSLGGKFRGSVENMFPDASVKLIQDIKKYTRKLMKTVAGARCDALRRPLMGDVSKWTDLRKMWFSFEGKEGSSSLRRLSKKLRQRKLYDSLPPAYQELFTEVN